MEKQAIGRLNSILDGIEVDKVGIVRLDDWKDTPLWQKAKKLLPGAKSIIVLASEVFPEVIKFLSSQAQVGELALRDLYNRNMKVVNGVIDWQAYNIVKKLHNLGFQGVPLPAEGGPFDGRLLEGTLSYKQAAQAAGLGVIGWHSMLITPEYGARVLLACVITDALLPSSASVESGNPCPECDGACIRVCPVSAIARPQEGESFKIDRNACSTYLNASGGCDYKDLVAAAVRLVLNSLNRFTS